MLLVFHPPYGWELNGGRGNRGNTVFFLGKKLPSPYIERTLEVTRGNKIS